jgi:hypothetical protein
VKIILVEHPNKQRHFVKGQLHDAKPGQKSHRIDVDLDTIKLSRDLGKLIQFFALEEEEVNALIKNEFGEGVGYQTTRIFLDRTYGPGFRLRAKTKEKYLYLLNFLKKLKKQFANTLK